MLISIEHRLAFLAVPKTGSTSIEATLAPHCDISFGKNPQIKHMTVKRFHRHMAPYLAALGHENIELCAVIREPIDWLGSWYRYRGRAELDGTANSTADMSFDAFSEAYMQDPKPRFATVGQQSIFLEHPASAGPIQHLFPFENMSKFREFLTERTGLELEFGTLNQSPLRTTDLSETTRTALKAYFEADYALWNDAIERHR